MPEPLAPSASDQTGVRKRDRTRAKLLQAAMSVYARQGFDAPTIDHFAAEAGVSRGTFYNYFQTREEVMATVAAELSVFITSEIKEAVRTVEDPLERIAVAIRYFVMLAGENETRAWVVARLVLIVGGPLTPSMSEGARADFEAAAATGRVHIRVLQAAMDMGMGMMAMAIRHNLSKREPVYPPELVAAMMLQSLGVSPHEAEEIASRPMRNPAG